MKKITEFVKKIKITEPLFAIAMLVVLFVALVPLLRLGLYAAPFYDDYGYAKMVKQTINAGGGFKEIFHAVCINVRDTWYSWQGTYASIAFMSVMPATFGEQYYFIGSWVLIFALAVSSFLFSFVVTRTFLGADKMQATAVSSIVAVFLIELIYTAHQGFYWYNGGVHYVFMFSMMLFMLTAGINVLYGTGKAGCIVHSLLMLMLSVMVAGANFVVTLQGILFLLVLVLLSVVTRNKKGFLFIIPVLAYAVGMWFNLKAPGNSHRSAFYTGYSPVKSIAYSFRYALLYIPEFTGLITIVVLAILVPILWNIVIKSERKFRLPGLVTLLSFCLYATGFTPSLYGMGNPGLERTLNVVKFTMQLLLVINEAYWLGWLANRLNKRDMKCREISHNVFYYLLCLLLVVIIFWTSGNQAGSFSSYGAYYYVHRGEAFNYRAEYLNTIDIIKNSDGGDVVVPAHLFRPWLLCGKNELSDDPSAEQNTMMANYYGIQSIRIETQD